MYGITRLSWQDFALGTFAGSAKPYLLDAYLGSLIKDGVVKADQGGGLDDAILVGTLVATVMTGTFASQLATRSFSELRNEIEVVDSARRANVGSDPLRDKQSFLDSLGFWGIRSADFPSFLAFTLDTLEEAQKRMRCVYSEQWAVLQRQQSQHPSTTPGDEHTPKSDALDRREYMKLRPELLEAEANWSFQWAQECAEALLTLPAFVEALGEFSSPSLWPKVLAEVKEEVEATEKARLAADFAWKRQLVRARQLISLGDR